MKRISLTQYLVERAGGLASNGEQRILDIVPGATHERVSVLLGSRKEVQRATDDHRGEAAHC